MCGDITIVGGNITALTQTYRDLAAIGAGTDGVCGNILIAGGTVNVTGPVAIGANEGHCGDIVVANTVTRMVSHTTHTYAFGDPYGAHVTIGNREGWAYNFTADTDFYGTQPLLHPAPTSINYPSLISPLGDGRYRVAQNRNVVAKATPNSCHHFVSWSTADSVLTADSAFTIPYTSLNQYTGAPLLATLQRDFYSSDTTVHAVNHYTWNGTEYTTGGDFQDSLYTAEGCDSLATLHLTLDYIDTITLAVNDTNMGSIEMLYAFTPQDTVDLSTIHRNITVQDGTVLTGTLGTSPTNTYGGNRKISVAAGATIMLSNMDITGVHNISYKWAGLTLLGDATIILDENTTNHIRGFFNSYPGIHVPVGSTLTICGSGELTAESGVNKNTYDSVWAAGIGGGNNLACGNIVILGGTINTLGAKGASIGSNYYANCGNIAIHGGTVNASSIGCGYGATIDSILITGGTVNAVAKDNQAGIGCDAGGTVNHIVITGGTINATGGRFAAGIGSGLSATVNHITITGGTITATGGYNGAGIGAGEGRNGNGHCGEIVIASTVTSVTAQKGTNSINVNNIGHGDGATCDTVIVGGQPYTDPETATYTYTGTGSSSNTQTNITTATPLPDGRYTVPRGMQVVAKATPKSDHHLARWSDGAAVNPDNTDTLMVTGSMLLTAIFAHDPYNIVVAAMDTSMGSAVVIYNDSSAVGLLVESDSLCTISATPKPGYHFVRWEEAGSPYSHAADTSVAATADRFFNAVFALTYDTITLAVNDTTMGSIAMLGSFMPTDTLDLSTVQADTTVQDGTVLTGTLVDDYKISVAAGASVLLKGIIIPGISTAEHPWAGLSLLGNATLFLDDSSYVKGYHSKYPGIHVPAGSTLTIRGGGILTAQPAYRAAGIGGGYEIDNGNIVIESGTIHAHGYYAAGIGGGYRAQSCGNIAIHGGKIDASSIGCGDRETIDSITITGGTVIATGNDFEAGVGTGHTGTVNHIVITGGTVIAQGGMRAAGIGGGIFAHCGEIVIDSTVTLVTSSKGYLTDTNIGTGFQGTFDTIIVGGQGYTDVSSPFSYSGNSSGNQFEPSTVIGLGSNIYRIQRGTTVVVQATPKADHHLASWSDGTAVNPASTDTLMVNGSILLMAIFEHNHYIISTAATDTAMGSAVVIYDDSVASSLPVEPGATFFLEATANPCHHFVCWTKGADTVASESIVELPATDTSFYIAHFEHNAPLSGDTTAVVCDSLVWFGTTYTATPVDMPTHNLTNAAGCDSTVTLHLTVNHSNTGDTSAVECDSLSWYSTTYATSAEPTHVLTNAFGCDSTVTLHLIINHSNTGDTSAVVCDSFTWYGTDYVATAEPTQLFENGNQWGCDSTVTLHLTINYKNTGDTTAVECDQFSWYEHDSLTASVDTLTHLFAGANQWGCDSTVTLHLTVNYQNTGDTTAVECDQFGWYEHTGLTASVDTLTHLFAGSNRWGCDSTVTLHLTVNYQNTGDTTAVECDQFTWYGTDYTSTAAPTHVLTNAFGCDSTLTLHLTINYQNTGDTANVVCDHFTWYGTDYTVTSNPTHLFAGGNQWGCDSTVTLHLTINYKNTGDTTAVECDQFSWYEHDSLTASTDTLTHLFAGANQWGCDSTVTLHLTVNYQNTGDTTAVECDQFGWYEHTGLTASVDTLTHLFAGGNRWGCDSTVTLHLTVNYQNTGDTTAVECDQFSWYEHTGITASVDTLTHLFAGGNQWGCDSTVTLHLTVNYQNTGDTMAVECDQFSWYEHTGITASVDTLTHLFAGANRWNCDSTVTLHLTVNYQNTGDTTAVECDQFSWYEHTGLTASVDTLTHLFAGSNRWGCDSTVTLHLTVNYQNTGDTTAVECDHFTWYGTDYTSTAAPTHVLTNAFGCDSTLTLHLTVNYQNTGDTANVVCDHFTWYGTDYTVTSNPTHLFAGGNQWGCDSTLTLHLTVNYQNTGDTTAVECDQFSWYEHTGLTASVDTLTHLFAGGNQWGCDSTVTLHLTINYQNTGDTTAVECDQFSWYEHTGLTTSVDTLTHLFAGGNQWGCDSTVTLHLTVNYQNTGDTSAVECNQFSWYEHQNITASVNTLTHLFAGANRWGCDSTVTLDLTINYQNTGDTTAVECDQFSWYEHQNLTASSSTLTHTFAGANQWGCDSTVTLHLTVHYQNTGDTSALTYEPYNWYEHHNMAATQNVQHTFVSANRWGCDSTVTLHLRYALFATDWTGSTTAIYNSQPQTGLGATYVDDTGRTQQVTLTFTKGSEVITTPNYPVTAGVWQVVARPVLPVDSLTGATTTLTILPATVHVNGAAAQIAKVVDGNTSAVVTDIGTLVNVQGSDTLTHTTTASFNDATVGEGKTITLTYALQGDAALLANYDLVPTTEVYTNAGAIVPPILPAANNAFDVAEYGYCTGPGTMGYHLSSGKPDQYKIDYADNRFIDRDWSTATGADGTLVINVPEGLPTGDYTLDVIFRESRFPWIESAPMTVTIHVDLPASYITPLFDNVIALVDTCQCFTDIQWYHRTAGGEWYAVPGATGYYYREVSGLTGEYFVSAKMNGMHTFTCPQTDLVTLVSDNTKDVSVSASPNPADKSTVLSIINSPDERHQLRVMNTLGVELECRTFEGVGTVLDLSHYQRGTYIVSIDGHILRVIKL